MDLKFNRQHLENMKKGIQYYNESKFWECHEELEDPWMESLGDEAGRYVYWTVIQTATALYHYLDGNLAGAKGQINRAKEKIRQCEKKYIESETLENALSWSKFKKLIKSIPGEPKLEDFDKLMKFKFKNPNAWDEIL